jgi:hypothetical protein
MKDRLAQPELWYLGKTVVPAVTDKTKELLYENDSRKTAKICGKTSHFRISVLITALILDR